MVKTDVFRTTNGKLTEDQLARCHEALDNGGVLIVPTDTVYGLVCKAFDPMAIAKIYELKGRDYKKPLPVFLESATQLPFVTKEIPKEAYRLVDKFWPGPLTVVLKTSGMGIHAARGRDTIAVRVPDHGVVAQILNHNHLPLASTSANLSGRPSIKEGKDAVELFSDKVDVIVDGGPCEKGRESSVVDATHYPFTVLRDGVLSKEDLLKSLI